MKQVALALTIALPAASFAQALPSYDIGGYNLSVDASMLKRRSLQAAGQHTITNESLRADGILSGGFDPPANSRWSFRAVQGGYEATAPSAVGRVNISMTCAEKGSRAYKISQSRHVTNVNRDDLLSALISKYGKPSKVIRYSNMSEAFAARNPDSGGRVLIWGGTPLKPKLGDLEVMGSYPGVFERKDWSGLKINISEASSTGPFKVNLLLTSAPDYAVMSECVMIEKENVRLKAKKVLQF